MLVPFAATVFAATAVRLAVAVISVGSNDVLIWREHAAAVNEHGLSGAYELISRFNHPPVPGYYAGGVLALAGDSVHLFAFLMKLPGIAADAGTSLVLWLFAAGSARRLVIAAAYAWSPLAVLISGFHGSTDAVAVFLAILAMYLFDRERPFTGGLALAAACNVKLIPALLIIPVALALRRQALAPAVKGFALGTAPLLVAALIVGAPFIDNVFAYVPQSDSWGLGLFGAVPTSVRIVMVAAVVATSWLSRSDLRSAAALAMCLFLVLAPGFGVQYLIYPLPFLLVVAPGWGVTYSLLSGAYAGLIYLGWWRGGFPVFSQFRDTIPWEAALYGLPAWLCLTGACAWLIRERTRRAPIGAEAGSRDVSSHNSRSVT